MTAGPGELRLTLVGRMKVGRRTKIIWRSEQELRYEIGRIGSGLWVISPAGWMTDLATTPRFVWWLLSPFDPDYAGPAIIHDRLCEDREFDRTITDAILYEAMKDWGAPWWKRFLVYRAVRMFSFWRGVLNLPPPPSLNPSLNPTAPEAVITAVPSSTTEVIAPNPPGPDVVAGPDDGGPHAAP